MCAICGCGGEHAPDHDYTHGHDHAHPHDHAHDHGHPHSHDHAPPHGDSHARHSPNLIELEARILAKNDALAQKNRGWFAGR